MSAGSPSTAASQAPSCGAPSLRARKGPGSRMEARQQHRIAALNCLRGEQSAWIAEGGVAPRRGMQAENSNESQPCQVRWVRAACSIPATSTCPECCERRKSRPAWAQSLPPSRCATRSARWRVRARASCRARLRRRKLSVGSDTRCLRSIAWSTARPGCWSARPCLAILLATSSAAGTSNHVQVGFALGDRKATRAPASLQIGMAQAKHVAACCYNTQCASPTDEINKQALPKELKTTPDIDGPVPDPHGCRRKAFHANNLQRRCRTSTMERAQRTDPQFRHAQRCRLVVSGEELNSPRHHARRTSPSRVC